MEGGEIFVPPMSAMRLIDFAEALAPGHPIDITGLRPGGEKIHEIVVTEEEATRSIPTLRYTVIAPHLHPWVETYRWRDNIGMLKGEVTSQNVGHLYVGAMRAMLEHV
jgi:FlaA1/EpsC-like NDP-sugar epimerase